MQKKAAIIQDISCFGKCSAGVALPIVSHFGIECALLPTALLSAHTGFKHYHCSDLTEMMETTVDDWKKEGLSFDGIYSGYMLGDRQIEIVSSFIDDFKTDGTFILVDPVMGDDGKAYAMLGESYSAKMKTLISRADVITPNLTEAFLLLQRKPDLNGYTRESITEMLTELRKLGCKTPMITGISFEKDKIGVAFLDGDEFRYISGKKHSGKYCGTGDTFASIVFSAMLCGKTIYEATQKALSAIDTAISNDSKWYGITFESALSEL